LTLAETANGETAIKGKLSSTPNTKFTIQFFATPPADGADEGKVLLGQKTVKTNDKGKATFTFTADPPVAVGENVTATATHKTKGDTSEFSAAEAVVAG
jgi:hypothetical protein